MRSGAARPAPSGIEQPQAPARWPHDISHEPSLRIGEVRERLRSEFPRLEISKIRYMEEAGLILPHRTASNQRLFSPAEVERLRFVLQQQRDRYLPLEQIGHLLRLLDAGEALEDVRGGRMRAVSDHEIIRPQVGTRLAIADVADLTGVAVADIEAMVKAGILKRDARGRLTSHAPEIVRFTVAMQRAGFDLRQIRSVAVSAHAHAVTVAQSIAIERAKKTPVAGERALTRAGESGAMMARLYRALLNENIEVELR